MAKKSNRPTFRAVQGCCKAKCILKAFDVTVQEQLFNAFWNSSYDQQNTIIGQSIEECAIEKAKKNPTSGTY